MLRLATTRLAAAAASSSSSSCSRSLLCLLSLCAPTSLSAVHSFSTGSEPTDTPAPSGDSSPLEPVLEKLFGKPQAAKELLASHPELGSKATPESLKQSVASMLGAGLSLNTIQALVRSCPRLLWRGPEFSKLVEGGEAAPWVKGEGAPQVDLGGAEPEYLGYWVPDYNPIHSSVTGVPCKWVGGPKPPLNPYVSRLLHLTTLAHSLPHSDDEGDWSDGEN